jgi:hypothetical protein
VTPVTGLDAAVGLNGDEAIACACECGCRCDACASAEAADDGDGRAECDADVVDVEEEGERAGVLPACGGGGPIGVRKPGGAAGACGR